MPVIRKHLYASEGSNPNTRVNPETGVVETTTDGGATWQPDPNSDPRSNPAFQLPLIDGGSCGAAAGMILQMKDFVAGVFGGVGAAGIAGGALFALTAMIPGAGWMFSVALLIAAAVVGAGAAIIQASFTAPVWEDLLCLILQFTDADGAFDQAGFDDFLAQVYTDLGDSVGFGVAQMFKAWGVVGFNNAGVLRFDEDADCSTCNSAWGYLWDFAEGDGNFAPYTDAGDVGGLYSVDRWVVQFANSFGCEGGNFYQCSIASPMVALPSGSTITRLAMGASAFGGGCSHAEMWVGADRTSALQPGDLYIYANGTWSPPLEISGESPTTGNFIVGAVVNWFDDTADIFSLAVEGTGTMPAFTGGASYTP